MIITCHILQGLNIRLAFWINVGVQIFFFISGFLYGRKELENSRGGLQLDWFKRQFKKIIIPLVILEIIMLFVDCFVFHIAYSKYQIIANLLGLGAFYGPFPVISHTWFIGYILICYLITPLLNKIEFNKMKTKEAYTYLIGIILFIQILEYFKVININAAWISNYIIGYFLSNHYIKNNKNYKNFAIILISLSIITLIPTLILQNTNYNLPAFIIENKQYLYDWNHVLIGSSLFMIMYTIFNRLKIEKHKILDLSDKYSYYIYLTHQIFILNYTSILYLTKSLTSNIILIFLFSVISGVLLYIISNLKKIIIKKE